MEKISSEELDARFDELVKASPIAVDEIVAMIDAASANKASEMACAALAALNQAGDFAGAWKLLLKKYQVISEKLSDMGIREALRKATNDRLVISILDAVGFGTRALGEAIARAERLFSLHPGALVLSQAWGLGEVRKLDYFYRRVTVDFRMRRGHQLTYDAACETLVIPPADHILVIQRGDANRIAQMLAEKPGEFVKEMLKSFGDMPITRLEDLAEVHGFVKKANWKAFWERARLELHRDKLVEIPVRRAEPIHLKKNVETYGEGWFLAFEHMTDPKSILSSVRELQGTRVKNPLSDADNAKIAERLAFAAKGARGVDDALYARIAFCVEDLKLSEPSIAKMRAYLWENDRYLAAARLLPARETGNLVVFMTAEDREGTKKKLFEALPKMCFPLLSETLEFFKNDADCADAVAAFLKAPNPPATLVTCILGRYENFAHWAKLPHLIVILQHAISLGEGKQSGETLKMQNIIRRLFADQAWLEKIFAQLQGPDRELFFERFQASITWEAATHHMITVRMTRLAPELAAHQIKVEAPKVAERITSIRSYAARKEEYLKLINVDMPKNAHDIDVARGYGDLRENFEYQSAKDEQRALLQKQSLMQADLDQVKAVDFANVSGDDVREGTMVTILTAAGIEKVYTILGEWDNDLEKNILSNKTRLAQNMMGKKAGDTFDLPDAEGNVSTATIKQISGLDEAMKAWVKGA